MVEKNKLLKFIFLVVIFILSNIIFFKYFGDNLKDIASLKQYLSGLENISYYFILIVIIQVIASFLPGQIAGLAGGYLFGVIWGTVYSMIGLMIGSVVAFELSRYFGKPFIEKYYNKNKFKKFKKFIDKNGKLSLFLIYLLPALPDDLLCFISGITNIKRKHFLFIVFFGRLPGFIILNLVGANIIKIPYWQLSFLIFILVIITFLSMKYKKTIELFILKIIKKVFDS